LFRISVIETATNDSASDSKIRDHGGSRRSRLCTAVHRPAASAAGHAGCARRPKLFLQQGASMVTAIALFVAAGVAFAWLKVRHKRKAAGGAN
jgi:hypothetical protein